jgi:hypothetical protein
MTAETTRAWVKDVLQDMERVAAIARSYRMEPHDADAIQSVLTKTRAYLAALEEGEPPNA